MSGEITITYQDGPITVAYQDGPLVVDIGVVTVEGPPGPEGASGSGGSDASLSFTAATALSGHKAVRAIGDGSVGYASADQVAQAGTVVGVTTGAAGIGNPISVVAEGIVDEPSWSWGAGPVWLGLNGALTQTIPQSGVLQRIGLALSPTRLLVALTPPILL